MKKSIENFANEYKFDNVYAESKPSRPFLLAVDNATEQIQTENEKVVAEGSSEYWS